MTTLQIIILVLISLIIIVTGYIIYNLLRKVELAEDLIISYNMYFNKVSNVIEASGKTLELLDAKGSFQSDDELGFFFKKVKEIQSILDDFKVKKI